VWLHRALYGLATFTVSYRKQESILTFTVQEVTHPAGWIISTENVALVCLHEKKGWAHVIAFGMEPLSTTSIDYRLFLKFFCVLVKEGS